MAHEWKYVDATPKGKYFKYWGALDIRECKKCHKIQCKEANYLWGRVTGYYWTPKVGRCPSDKKGHKNEKN